LTALAEVGDLKDAEAGLKAQELTHPASPAWEAKVGATVRAEILLQEHRPGEVAAVLEVVRPFEGSGLDSWYLRAVAYAQNGEHEKAVGEYQRLLAAQAIDPSNVDIPLAELGLARSLVAIHRSEDARKAYASFLKAWAHADADIPLRIDAQNEAAELNRLAN
jgi:tetratricopeptide (TPR) repeat protein